MAREVEARISEAFERGEAIEALVQIGEDAIQLQIPKANLKGMTLEEQQSYLINEARRLMPPKKARKELEGEWTIESESPLKLKGMGN